MAFGGFGKIFSKVGKVVEKIAKPIIKPLRPLAEMAGLLPTLDAVDTGEGEPLTDDPAGVGDEAKPLAIPTADTAVVQEARRRALLARTQASGRRSTILADKRY